MDVKSITEIEKKLDKQSITFEELKEGLIELKNVKDEYRQAAIILIRDVFKQWASQTPSNENDALPIQRGVSDLLIAWEQFKKDNWWESDAVDVERVLIDKFQAIYGNNKTCIMDIELRGILDKVYANKMKPDEAQWKICVLFNVSNSVCRTFVADGATTSATKCKFCGKEKWEH